MGVWELLIALCTKLGICSTDSWQKDVLIDRYDRKAQLRTLCHFMRTWIGFEEMRSFNRGIPATYREEFFEHWYRTCNKFVSEHIYGKPHESINFVAENAGKQQQVAKLQGIDHREDFRCVWVEPALERKGRFQEFRGPVLLLRNLEKTLMKVEKMGLLDELFKLLVDLRDYEQGTTYEWTRLRDSKQKLWVTAIILSPYDLLGQFESENANNGLRWNKAYKAERFVSITGSAPELRCVMNKKSRNHIDFHRKKINAWVRKPKLDMITFIKFTALLYSYACKTYKFDLKSYLKMFLMRFDAAAIIARKEARKMIEQKRFTMSRTAVKTIQRLIDFETSLSPNEKTLMNHDTDYTSGEVLCKLKTEVMNLQSMLRRTRNRTKERDIKCRLKNISESQKELVFKLKRHWDKNTRNWDVKDVIRTSLANRWEWDF